MSRLVFGRYKLESRLGGGGMGEVFLARDLQTDGKVCVKISKTRVGGNERDQQRVLAEASLLSRLDHPGIHKIFDCGIDQGEYYYVMEYIEGTSLVNSKTLSLADKVEIFNDCANILNHVHSRGIVHRDIKPENVVVMPEKSGVSGTRAKLIDFGLAYFSGKQRITDTGHVVGTLNYMAPELLMGIDFDYRADLYSFGVTMYYTLTGRLPIEARQTNNIAYNILNSMPDPPSKYNLEISSELDQIVLSLLRRDPKERIQTAAELGNMLSDLCQSRQNGSSDSSSITVNMPMLFERDAEMDHLFERYNASTDSSCCVVVQGPFGIGKSRLVEEFAIKAQFQGAVVLRAHGINSAAPEPLYGLRQLFWNLQHYPYFESIQKKTTEFASLASMNTSMMLKYKVRTINVKFSIEDRLKSFSDLVSQMCKSGQVIVFIDDCDEIDSETLNACLQMVVDNPRNFFLLVTTEESKGKPFFAKDSDLFSQIRLPPIQDISEFAKSSLGVDSLDESLISNLQGSTMGIPNLVLDQLRSYVTTKSLEFVDGILKFHLEKAKSIKTYDFIASILDSLSDKGKQLLNFAGIYGQRFQADMVLKILGFDQKDGIMSIDELVRLGVLIGANESGTVFYTLPGRFVVNVRAYVSSEDTRNYNRLIAQYLESDPSAKPEWIFYHYNKACETDKSVHWAIRICERLLEEKNPEVDKYIEFIASAANAKNKSDWGIKAKLYEAKNRFSKGGKDEALSIVEDCISTSLVKGLSSILLDCFMEKAEMFSSLRKIPEAIEVRIGSIHLARMTLRPDIEFEIFDSLSKMSLQLLRMDESLEYAKQAYSIAKIGSKGKEIQALNSLVARHVENHNITDAEKLILESLRNADMSSNEKASLQSMYSRILWLKGEVENANSLVLELLNQAPASFFPTRTLHSFASIMHSAGKYRESREILDTIEQIAQRSDDVLTAKLKQFEQDFEIFGWQDILTRFEYLIENVKETGRMDVMIGCWQAMGDIASHIPNLEVASNAFEKAWSLVKDSKFIFIVCNVGYFILTAINQPLSKNELKKIADVMASLPEQPNEVLYEIFRIASLGMHSIIEGKNPQQVKRGIETLTQAKTMAIASGHRQRMGHLTKLLGKIHAQEYRFSRSENDRKLAEQNFFESEFIYRSIGANWLADFVADFAGKYLY